MTRTVLLSANDAIAAGDIEGFLSHCTDDTVWTFVGDVTLTGKHEVRQWLTDTYTTPPVNHVTELIAEGDHLVAHGVVTVGETTSDYCDVWTLRGGKLDTLRAFVIDR